MAGIGASKHKQEREETGSTWKLTKRLMEGSAGAGMVGGQRIDAGSPGTEIEEDVGDGVVVLPWLLGLAWMKKTMIRSLRSHRQGVRWPVAMATVSGCLGCARRREEERPEEGGETEEGGESERGSSSSPGRAGGLGGG